MRHRAWGGAPSTMGTIEREDHDKYIAESHKLNFPNIPFVRGDIRKENIKKEIIDAIGNKKVDKPISMYAITKKSMELISTLYSTNNKMRIFGVRFFTVYGSYSRPDMSLYKFAKNISTGKPIDVFNEGNHFRSFTYIDDVIFNLERLINFKSNKGFAKVVSIGNPRSVNLMYYISLIEKMANKKSIKKMLPKQKGDVQKSVNNKVREKRFYGFKYKTSIEQGIKFFFEWYDKKEI